MDKRKILQSFIVLIWLLASLAMACTMFGNGTQHSFAQSSGVTVTDFYISSGQEPWGTTFDSKGNVWVAVPGCDPSPTCSPSTPPGKIEEYNPSASSWIATYQLPTGYAQPLFLAFDAQGNLWFPMPMSNSIGMLNPVSKTFLQIPVPTSGAGPWDIAIDHNGKIWFTEHYSNKIGELDPSTQTITEISTPASNSQPYGIVVDAFNNIWFTENNSAVALIGEYTSGGTLNEYKIRTNPPGSLTPHLISVDPNGTIWWTEGFVGMIGELNVSKAVPGTNNGVTEYAYPASCTTCGTHTSGISIDSFGQVWFDDSLQSIFGSFPDTGTGSFSVYATPTPNSHPHDGLNVDTQNRIWFTEEFANKLAEAIQNGAPTPTPSTSPSPNITPSPSLTVTPTLSPSPTVSVTASPTPTPGTVLAQDTFQRPNQAHWGTASDGHTWGGDANTASVFSIVNNSGQVANGSSIYNAVLGSTATDAEVLFSGSMSSYSNANLGALLRWTDSNNWYKAYINGTTLVVQKKVSGATTTIGSVPFAATAGTSYTVRFRVVGSILYAKVWPTGTTEPTTWQITVTDTAFSAGFCGLRMQLASGVTASYTAFQATVPGGTPTPTPTPSPSPSPTPSPSPSPTPSPSPSPTPSPSPSPTPSPSPSPTPSPTVTVTATPTPSPTPGTALAQDTFQRPNQAHWGTASDGHTWGGDANAASVFSIVNNSGQVTNTTTTYSAILGPVATNAEVLFTGSMSNYTNNNLGAVLRWTDSNNWYKAYINGTTLVVQKKVSGATTIIGSAPFAATAGTSYTVRFRVVGTTLYAKVWPTGTTEPTTWQITVTDTTFASGFCGLRMLAQNGTTATYTSFLATAQ